MIEGRPSRTAMRVALRRAAHQLFDSPKVLEDPLAVRIVGREAAASLSGLTDRLSPPARYMRAFMAVRARYAEDELVLAVRRGVTQLVILGAGLDTFAYRNPFPNLRVFEVDHPATRVEAPAPSRRKHRHPRLGHLRRRRLQLANAGRRPP